MKYHILARGKSGFVEEIGKFGPYKACRLVAGREEENGEIKLKRLLTYKWSSLLEIGNSVVLEGTGYDYAQTKIIINASTNITGMNQSSIGSGYPFNDSDLVNRAKEMVNEPVYDLHNTYQIKNKNIPSNRYIMVSLKGEIIQVSEKTERTDNYLRYEVPKPVRDILVRDDFGTIKAALWHGCCDFPLKVGQRICIQDATIVIEDQGDRSLSVVRNDELEIMED